MGRTFEQIWIGGKRSGTLKLDRNCDLIEIFNEAWSLHNNEKLFNHLKINFLVLDFLRFLIV